MADYLYPNEFLTITEQRSMFALRNKMVAEIPANFCSSENNRYTCICNKTEDIKHIYHCKILNKDEPMIKFEKLFGENTQQQKILLKRFEDNMKTRNENMMKNEPCDPMDPLSSVVEDSFG